MSFKKNKIPKWAIFLILIGLVTAFIWTSCSIQSIILATTPKPVSFDEKMMEVIREDGTLVMTDATNFEWDELWIMGEEYDQFEKIGKKIGIELENYLRGGGGCSLFFFNNGEQVVGYPNYYATRIKGFDENTFVKDMDGNVLKNILHFTPETAVFKVEPKGEWYRGMYLLPIDKD